MATDKQVALYQELWRRAYRGHTITITRKEATDAIKLRFDLYRAVKRYRDDKELDPELHAAAHGCSISFGPGQLSLIIKKHDIDAGLLDLADELGIDMGSLTPAPKDRIERDAQESERRMLQALHRDSERPSLPPTQEINAYREPAQPAQNGGAYEGASAGDVPPEIRKAIESPAPRKPNPYYNRDEYEKS